MAGNSGGWGAAEAAREAEVEAALAEALGWLRRADALLIVGRGPVEDTGGMEGGAEGAEEGEAMDPTLFAEDPRAAWGRWLPRHRAAFRRRPAAGCGLLRRLCDQVPMGALACTTDVHGLWQDAGWPAHRLVELRGSARWLQCSEPCCGELWGAEEELGLEVAEGRAVGLLPSCRRCSEVARPWVRLARWDEAFLDGDLPWQATRNSMSSWATRLSNLTVVQLELGEDVLDRGYWEELEEATHGLRQGRLVRVALGATGDEPSTESHIRVRLDWPLALERLQRLYAEVRMATFIVTDVDGGGAEVIMPMDVTAGRLFLRTTMEIQRPLDWRHGEPFHLRANHIYSGTGRRDEALDWEATVSQEMFTKLRDLGDDQELGVSIKVFGVRYLEHNWRLHERILGVRSLLVEMLAHFRTPEYQERLALANDQAEVKALIKEVHVAVIPKYGFPLTLDTDVGKTIKAQICMQTHIDSVTPFDGWLQHLSSETLRDSGVERMGKLPVRLKGKDRVPPSRMQRTSHFKHHDPAQPLLYGTWLGDYRAPAAFVEAPCYDLLNFLREDPEGPFSGIVDDWPVDGLEGLESRWKQWGFEKDKREVMLKSDWHTLPLQGTGKELFVPRLGKAGMIPRAPPRYMAFAQAFRDANKDLFKHLASVLKELAVARMSLEHVDTDGSALMSELAQCIEKHGHLGVMEAQVWWGDEPLTLPSHKDGATSLLHLGLTLGGVRTLRVGTYPSIDDGKPSKGRAEPSVWDTMAWLRDGQLATGLKDVRMVRGCAYLSSPYCFEHGVRYERGTRNDPIIALQCRVAFSPDLGMSLNNMRDDLMLAVSNSVASLLKRTSESGKLRMPSLEEVLACYAPRAAA